MAQRANTEGDDSVTTEAEQDHHDPGRSQSAIEPSRFHPDLFQNTAFNPSMASCSCIIMSYLLECI